MIHWEYIKGTYQEAVDGGTPYTFIKFYGGNKFKSDSTEVKQEELPTIELASDNTNNANKKSAGYIVTSAITQDFTAVMNFIPGLKIHHAWQLLEENSALAIKNQQVIARFSDAVINLDTAVVNVNHYLNVNEYLRINNAFSSNPKDDDGDLSAKAIYSEGVCEAQYFNATSDRRAKTNIKPIVNPVLDLVKNTQVYSFTYKDLDTPSIGIIAQDVKDVEFDGFSLVDNKEATGQTMDYMSIHESKLIYILWKAIQEQQAEIEELKRQLKKD